MLKVVEDVPGEKVVLSGSGSTANLLGRIVLTAVFGPLIPGVPIAVAYALPSRTGALVPVFVLWLLAFGWVSSAAGNAFGDWTLLSWSASEGKVRLRRSGALMIWFARAHTFPIGSLEGLVLDAGSGGKDHIPMVIRMRFLNKRQRKIELEPLIRVDGVESRFEAMELALKIGRVLGWGGYTVRHAGTSGVQTGFARRAVDVSGVRLELLRDEPPRSAGLPIPDAISMGDLSGTGAMGRFEEPPFELPTFNPERLGDRYELLTWNPGTEVTVFRPPLTRNALYGAFLIGFALGGIAVLVFLAPLIVDTRTERVIAVVSGGVAGGLLNAFWFGHRERVRETSLEWDQSILRLKDGTTERAINLAEIEAVDVWGRRHADGKGVVQYRCDIELSLRHGSRELAATKEYTEIDPPLGTGLNIAIGIARALKVPWRFMGFPPGGSGETAQPPAAVPPSEPAAPS